MFSFIFIDCFQAEHFLKKRSPLQDQDEVGQHLQLIKSTYLQLVLISISDLSVGEELASSLIPGTDR
ncbi:MAG: hypothetical protein RLZZ574_3178 [Cyanobacteriota bacterium]